MLGGTTYLNALNISKYLDILRALRYFGGPTYLNALKIFICLYILRAFRYFGGPKYLNALKISKSLWSSPQSSPQSSQNIKISKYLNNQGI